MEDIDKADQRGVRHMAKGLLIFAAMFRILLQN